MENQIIELLDKEIDNLKSNVDEASKKLILSKKDLRRKKLARALLLGEKLMKKKKKDKERENENLE
jgi:hypothetical protein